MNIWLLYTKHIDVLDVSKNQEKSLDFNIKSSSATSCFNYNHTFCYPYKSSRHFCWQTIKLKIWRNNFVSIHVNSRYKFVFSLLVNLKTMQTFSVRRIAMGRWWSSHSRTTIIKWIAAHASVIERITTEVLICTANCLKQIRKFSELTFPIKSLLPKSAHSIAGTRRRWTPAKYWIIATITTTYSTTHRWTTTGSSNAEQQNNKTGIIEMRRNENLNRIYLPPNGGGNGIGSRRPIGGKKSRPPRIPMPE